MKINESYSKKTQTFISASAVLLATLTIAVSYHTPLSAAQTRQEEVARRGAKVMPFDLEQTTHVFDKLDDGGLQKVVVKDPANKKTDCIDTVSPKRRVGKVPQGRLFRPG